jgi:nicotinamidase-related amidase
MTDAQGLEARLPLSLQTVVLGQGNIGLVIVDAVVGFTRRGNLADALHMVPMVGRIAEVYHDLTDRLGERLRVLCFVDRHHADIPEPPYPPHCVTGTGEDELDPDLEFLKADRRVTFVAKDCINGFVGAIDRATGVNAFCRWVIDHRVETLLVTGDCTDICVSDFVLSTLSARNHGLLTDRDPVADRAAYVAAITGLRVAVLADACDTFDAPGFHERAAAHHVGLWMMASRGALVASDYVIGAR